DARGGFLASGFVLAPHTVSRTARKRRPGSVLIYQAGQGLSMGIERYARPSPVSADQVRSEDEETLAQELRDRLRDSVRAHLVADVPVGVFLSGGIDCSLIVALSSAVTSGPVLTFSVGFEERRFAAR